MDESGRVALQLFDNIDWTVLALEPVFEEGFGCLPKIEVRIELASQTFNIEECLLKSHQLRLHFHVKSRGRTE